MEEERRKRPALLFPPNEEKEEEEEEKMEKFFALLRSIRATKDRWIHEINKSKKRKLREEKKEGWTPSFEWEDFSQMTELKRADIPASSSNKAVENEEDGSRQAAGFFI
ncbi:protein NIM1-INTERACTING 1-like [Magnolia sinica]|uniref:protein NIM1-INTERACTING 1-like n=1 Tax=Magnolia sinica TaxID=86752 RepID=UPI00265AFF50|nr:protein NIM1-INTERACTING 1-like [Magnolia sinica]